jgi:hydroxyacylglutathione hydrolase
MGQETTGNTSMLQISAISACIQNYIWIFHTEIDRKVWIVDPGDSSAVNTWLKKNDKELAGVLLTHHHWDHVNGVEDIINQQTPVFGPALEPFKLTNQHLSEGDTVNIGWLNFRVLELHGHTQHHIAYLCTPEQGPPMLFCGDILFSAGCGRLKQGTAAQLFESLNRMKMELTDDTLIYCGHEYTLDNLKFALTVEPTNGDAAAHREHCLKLRDQGLRTVPSRMDLEKRINPFLRCDKSEIISSCENHFGKKPQNPQECFAALRKWKDNFT